MQGYARDDCEPLLNQDRRPRLECRVYRLPFLEARIFFRTMWSAEAYAVVSLVGEDSFLIKPWHELDAYINGRSNICCSISRQS